MALPLAFWGKYACLAVQASSDCSLSVPGLQSKHARTAVRELACWIGGLEGLVAIGRSLSHAGLAGYKKSVTQLWCASRSWMSGDMLRGNCRSGNHFVVSLSPFLPGAMGVAFRVSPALACGMSAFWPGWVASAFTLLSNPSTCTVSVPVP